MDTERIIDDFKRLDAYKEGRLMELEHLVARLTNETKTRDYEIGALKGRVKELIGMCDEFSEMVEQLRGERDDLIEALKDIGTDTDSAVGSTTTNLGPAC